MQHKLRLVRIRAAKVIPVRRLAPAALLGAVICAASGCGPLVAIGGRSFKKGYDLLRAGGRLVVFGASAFLEGGEALTGWHRAVVTRVRPRNGQPVKDSGPKRPHATKTAMAK
jgi:hypothetical protein